MNEAADKTGRCAGKTVLISAAAQGMGRASALALAREGATVWVTDVQTEPLQELVTQAAGQGLALNARTLDVRDGPAVQALADELQGQGGLDVLFNCVGFVHQGDLLNCAENDWDFSFDLNIKSMYRMTRAFLPGMLQRAGQDRGASLINMSSMCSSLKGFAQRCAYGTTKAAVIGFTKSVAVDYVGQGLRANAICPGTVDTPSLRDRINQAADPSAAERAFIARQPMGRLARVDDITPLVVYLASDESRYMTGQALLVDGGVTA